MAALAQLSGGLLAHGGLPGVVSELVIAVTVAGVLGTVWWRERHRRAGRAGSRAPGRDE